VKVALTLSLHESLIVYQVVTHEYKSSILYGGLTVHALLDFRTTTSGHTCHDITPMNKSVTKAWGTKHISEGFNKDLSHQISIEKCEKIIIRSFVISIRKYFEHSGGCPAPVNS